jgi:DNA-binding CsgD family transcriptional regulator
MGKEAKLISDLRIIDCCIHSLLDCTEKQTASGWISTLHSIADGLEIQLRTVRALIERAGKSDAAQFANRARTVIEQIREALTRQPEPAPRPRRYDRERIRALVARLRAQGLGASEIADQLNRDGWTSGRGGMWSPQAVRMVKGVTA